MADKSYPRKAEAQRKRWADPAYRKRWIAGAKARWDTPEHRAKMAAAGFRPVTAEDHVRTPGKWSRLGIPAGMTCAEAEAAWAEAAQRGDVTVRDLEAQGVLEAAVIPGREEALAKAAIHALAMIALGPMKGQRDKARALSILLSFTKAKPAQKIDAKINSVEEWLKSLAPYSSGSPIDDEQPRHKDEADG